MKLKHFDHDGRARFITFCTHKRIPFLIGNRFRRIIIKTISEVRDEESFRMLGYVIKPEHVHLVIVPKIDTKIGHIIGEIKRRSAAQIHDIMTAADSTLMQRLSVVRNGKPRFVCWQRRCYDHNCRSDKKVREKIDYCHINPVKRGLVSGPERWDWSSYRWYQGASDAVLEMDIAV